MKTVLIFGGTGSVGSFLVKKFSDEENVITPSRHFEINEIPNIDAVIWCQGVNKNDSIHDLEYEEYINVIDVNLNYITKTLNLLIKNNKLNKGSRCLVISSIWQEYSRSCKFSYTVSKAAIGGLVRSCSIDLGKDIFMNALLPGPIDNEMTRSNLSDEQMKKLPGFVNLEDIWQLSRYLCLYNMSTNGQSIKIDLGFSVNKM